MSVDHQNTIVSKTLEVTKIIQLNLSYEEAMEQLSWLEEHLKEVRQNVVRNHALRDKTEYEMEIID